MKRTKQIVTLLIISTLIGNTSCRNGHKNGSPSSDAPMVTVSIQPLKFFVDRLAGSTVQVAVMVPPGTSPETFDPQPSAIEDFSKSKLYFAIGLIDFEKSLEDKLSGGTTRYVNLSASTTPMPGADPHIWTSCREAKIIANTIAHELTATFPQNAEIYTENLKQLIKTIDSTDSQINTIISNLQKRQFIIYHPSLGYFARDYKLQQLSIETEGKEPSARELILTVRAAKSLGISTILVQKQFDTKNAKTMAADIGGQVIEIDPLALDWPQQMVHIAKAISQSK